MNRTAWITGLLVGLWACSPQPGGRVLDTPTSGAIRIAADQSLKPVVEAEVNAFEAIYRKAHLDVVYVPEVEAVRLLMFDSVRVAVITRSLTALENEQLRQQKLTPHEQVVARESVAWIVHPSGPDSTFTENQLIGLFTDPSSKHRVVFDDPSSGVVRYVNDSLLHGRALSANTYSLKSNEAVIEYVSREKSAVGIIGGAWIADRDDSTTNQFLKSVRVAALENQGAFYQPFQAYLAQRLYPFTRNIVMCSREPRAGLGSGFMSFVASDKGQRVILKAGLLPTTMPVRVVEVNRRPL